MDLLKATYETILMTLISTFIAYIIGLPLGILLASTSKSGIMKNKPINLIVGLFVNIMRSIPCLLLIIILLPFTRSIFGRGTGQWYTMLIPLIFATFGYVARVVESSFLEVDQGVIEAVRSMGATNFQIIKDVYFVEAKPSLIRGLALTIVNVLGYTAFAYDFGAGGLISSAYSYYSTHTSNYLSSYEIWVILILIVLIIQIIQECGLLIAKKSDKRRKSS